jgi:hypothetical protein
MSAQDAHGPPDMSATGAARSQHDEHCHHPRRSQQHRPEIAVKAAQHFELVGGV